MSIYSLITGMFFAMLAGHALFSVQNYFVAVMCVFLALVFSIGDIFGQEKSVKQPASKLNTDNKL